MSEIIRDLLYLADAKTASNSEWLQKHKIKHVLNMGSSLSVSKADVEKLKLQYRFIDIEDAPDVPIAKYFAETIQYIQKCIRDHEPIVVHCFMGMSRSATIVIAYLMQTYRLSVDEALNRIRRIRPIVLPNPGFMLQLRHFEGQLFIKDTINELQMRHFDIQSLTNQTNDFNDWLHHDTSQCSIM
jgi:dual specificity phosphatase 12